MSVLLEFLGIHDSKTYKKWLLENHPDKQSQNSKIRIDLVKSEFGKYVKTESTTNTLLQDVIKEFTPKYKAIYKIDQEREYKKFELNFVHLIKQEDEILESFKENSFTWKNDYFEIEAVNVSSFLPVSIYLYDDHLSIADCKLYFEWDKQIEFIRWNVTGGYFNIKIIRHDEKN